MQPIHCPEPQPTKTRHNPYASPVSPYNIPTHQPSTPPPMSSPSGSSFASAPMTPPTAFGGAAMWAMTPPTPPEGMFAASPFMQQHAPMPSHAAHNNHASNSVAAPPTYDDLIAMQGSMIEHARTANGSSFIQSAVKETADPRCVTFIWAELAPALSDLLLDAHGCYVIKTLLDRLPSQELRFVLDSIAADEQLGFSICTHSLHTRRVVQHIIENVDGLFLCDLMARRPADIAMTQQGCIVMQRSMDNSSGPARDALLAAICSNIVLFARDPFANYVVQHLMEVGEREATAFAMWKAVEGRVVELACNKFASNVIEKCLFHVTARVQHDMLVEMYSAGPQILFNMLQDSFGNYIIQSSIALATFRDVAFIDEKLRPVLVHTPYGHKIEARLDRRLKGKPVTARSPLLPHANGSRRSQRKEHVPHHAAADAVPEGEVPW